MSDQKISALLFDLDGTLINTNELIIQSFHHALSTHQLTVAEEEIYRHFGKPLWDQFALFAPGQEDEVIATYRQFNGEMHDRLTQPFPGIDAMLAELSQRGYRLAIVSSKVRSLVERGLRLFGLEQYFPLLVCAEDTTEHKPHPAPVLRALELLGVDSRQAAMIGDSPFDLLAAKAAGVTAVGVLWSSFPRLALEECYPDHLVEQPADLLTLFAPLP